MQLRQHWDIVLFVAVWIGSIAWVMFNRMDGMPYCLLVSKNGISVTNTD